MFLLLSLILLVLFGVSANAVIIVNIMGMTVTLITIIMMILMAGMITKMMVVTSVAVGYLLVML